MIRLVAFLISLVATAGGMCLVPWLASRGTPDPLAVFLVLALVATGVCGMFGAIPEGSR